MSRDMGGTILKWLRSSIWTFPLILSVVLITFTTLKISGTSSGIYYSSLYGTNVRDPALVYGKPQAIRSDEYRGSTPLAALQEKTGKPSFNKDLGSGRDLTLIQDAPVKNWVGIFRPQNFSFFVLPFEYAYAFRWWVVLYFLIVCTYFFILRVLPGKRPFAVLLSVAFGLSPYLLWWYQAPVFLPFAYSLLAIIIGMRIINGEKLPHLKSPLANNVIYCLGLFYLGASFGLLVYAPFLIPAALVILALILGHLLNVRAEKGWRLTESLRKLTPFAVAMVLIAVTSLVFIHEHQATINSIANSQYPGHRITISGDLPYSHLFPWFGSFLMPILQMGSHANHYYANQSEASNYILLLPFLLLPGMFLQVLDFRKKGKLDYSLVFINMLAILLLVRLTLPLGDNFFKVLLLNRVPNTRLIAGIGFVGFLQLIYFIKLIDSIKFSKKWVYGTAAYSVICFSVLILTGLFVMHRYPIFLHSHWLMIGLAVGFQSIVTAFLLNKKYIGAILLLGFTLISSLRILPLYRGLDFYINSPIVKAIDNVSAPSEHWVVLDSLKYESLPEIAGRGLISGNQIYTDLSFWRQLDPTGQFTNIYNRQGHALFLSNTLKPNPTARYNVTSVQDTFGAVKSNVFKVKFTCSDFTYRNIQFALAQSKIDKSCLKLTQTVPYPKTTFYLYRVVVPKAG